MTTAGQVSGKTRYANYLSSAHWQDRRNRFISATHKRCFICRTKNLPFHVHHKRYRRGGISVLGAERHTDLRLLCNRCHYLLHANNLERCLTDSTTKRRTLRDLLLTIERRGISPSVSSKIQPGEVRVERLSIKANGERVSRITVADSARDLGSPKLGELTK